MRLGLVVALLLGLVTAAAIRPLLRWLPEPEAGDGKIPYRDLGTPAFVIGIAVLVSAAAAIATLRLPAAVLPVWWVLSSLGVLLSAIDARTTWLPLRLTRLTWLLSAVAMLVVGFTAGWPAFARGLGGAVLAGALYFAVWWASRGGFGFGDVRFAPLLGAATAAGSWTLLLWGLVLGTLLGGAQGLARLCRRRRGGFAYAPAILGGGYLACALLG